MDSSPSAPKLAVVIPCYRASRQVLAVIGEIPPAVAHIFVVDDGCPEKTGQLVETNCRDARVKVVYHPHNRGVGSAMVTGYRAALATDAEIVVKIDGDGQMDPAHLPALVRPIVSGAADFSKGNRFFHLEALQSMPLVRRVGNLGLTLLLKAASGHWHVSDPTNGYVAIHRRALELLPLHRLSRGYFFESSLLIQLNVIRAVVVDVPLPARYGAEVSSLSIWRVLFGFPPRLARGMITRVGWRYFFHDISAVTIFLVVGLTLFSGGLIFGAFHWWSGWRAGQLQSAGTVALAMLPIILGMQMLLQAMLLDVVEKPATTLQAINAGIFRKS